jgi:hypothetical protein
MKRSLINGIACAGLLLFSLSARQAVAQDRDNDRNNDRDNDSFYHSREGFYSGDSWRMHLFDRVRADLDHVQRVAFSGSDEYRIVRTKEQVAELQSKMAEGRYDQPELEDVLAGLGRVVADNRLSPRDRDILSEDLSRVRDYRDHHDNWR